MLPAALVAHTRKRRFWTDYFGITSSVDDEGDSPYDDLAECTVRFALAPGDELHLGLGGLPSVSLSVPVAGRNALLAFQGGNAEPDVLRWAELDILCRSIAVSTPSLPHPGLPLLLLCPFAPITAGDDADGILELLETAWKSQRLPFGRHFDELWELRDMRGAGFTWRHSEPFGSELVQDKAAQEISGCTAYSRRRPGSTFPAPEWNELMAAAAKHCRAASAEPLLADRLGGGSLLGRSSRRPVRPMHAITVIVPSAPGMSPVEELVSRLDRCLRDQRIGHADEGGTTYRSDTHEAIDDSVWVRLHGEREPGLKIIVEALRREGAPGGTLIFWKDPAPQHRLLCELLGGRN